MLKIEKEYLNEYGNIPKDEIDRFDYLLKDINLSRCKTTLYNEISRISKISWKKISYTIYLLPKGTPRPRQGKGGIFYVKGAKDNKKLMEEFVKGQDINLIITPIKFICKSYYPIPKSMNPIEKLLCEFGFARPMSTPDWDNVAKAYCDMIKGFLIYDDAQIIEGVSTKYYSIKPRIEVTIEYMEDFDINFNRRKFITKG